MLKNYPLLLVALLCTYLSTQASNNVPEGFGYQAVVRDAMGNIIQNQPVAMRFTIRDTSANGPAIFQQTDTVIPNQFGIITVIVGGGSISVGSLGGINWANGSKFMQVETDVTGGNNYADMGTTQLLSVPYALYALNSGSSTPGPQGPAGITGPTGLQGPAGAVGATGADGAAGPQGPAGVDGAIGPQGPAGATGAQGPTGPDGAVGPRGATGQDGVNGITGATGPQGEAGAQGPKGDTGEQGDKGNTGATGPQGPAGTDGVVGTTGDTGATGAKGDTGEQGPAGAQGPKGDTGAQGEKGDTGNQGPMGPAGTDGAVGTPGATGAKGDTGEQGPVGPQGPKGDTGAQGPAGSTGAQGPMGPSGADGAVGAPGADGAKGATGAQGPTGVADSVWSRSGNNIYNNNPGKVGINTSNPQADLDVNGFTRLGGADAPFIKMKRVDGTMPASNSSASTSTGIPDDKVLQVLVTATDPAKGVIAPLTDLLGGVLSGVEYSYTLKNGVFTVSTTLLNSLGIVGKPYKAIILYEQ